MNVFLFFFMHNNYVAYQVLKNWLPSYHFPHLITIHMSKVSTMITTLKLVVNSLIADKTETFYQQKKIWWYPQNLPFPSHYAIIGRTKRGFSKVSLGFQNIMYDLWGSGGDVTSICMHLYFNSELIKFLEQIIISVKRQKVK